MSFQLVRVDHLPKDGLELPDKLLPFIWYFVRQAKWQFALIAIIYAISNITEALSFYFIKVFVDTFEQAESRDQIWDDIFWPLMLFVLICLIIQPIMARVGQWLQANARPAFANMVRRQLSLHMNNHSFQYFQDDFSGRLSSKVMETPTAMSLLVQTMLSSIWFALSTLGMSVIFMAMSHWLFAIITGVWLAMYCILLRFYVPKVSEDSKQAHDLQSKSRGRYVDIIANILTVKIFARKDHEDKYFLSSISQTSKGFQQVGYRINSMYIWLEVISVLYILAIFLCVIWGWQNNVLSAGDVAMILPLAIRVTNISWWMSDVISMIFEAVGQIKEGMETITKSHTVTDKPDAPKLHVKAADIEIKGMTFSYGRQEE